MSLIVDRQPSSQLVGISKGPLVAALFGHAAIFKLSQPSGVKRKLDLDPAMGRFWRKAVVRRNVEVKCRQVFTWRALTSALCIRRGSK
jgi:hypothetical protein